MSRTRAWTFTLNNYSFDELVSLIEVPFRYLCFGFEVGANNTPHLQGYVYFDDAKTFTSVKQYIPRAHLEVSRGTAAQNAVYTSKDDDWYEFGDIPQQGAAKWDAIEDVMADPKSNPHLFNQYSKMYRQLTLSKKKDHERNVYLIKHSERYMMAKMYDTVMFNYDIELYDGEQAVFMDCYQAPVRIIEDWIHDFPPKIKRGYELICFDPQFILILYKDLAEWNYLMKTFSDVISIDNALL